MGETLREAAERQFGFNPGQMRGPDGKWIHVGAAVSHAVHGKGTVTNTHALGKVSVRFDRGGLKKVSGRDLNPSGHDPLGGQIDEEILHQSHLRRQAMDRADEEAAHRRHLKGEALDRAAARRNAPLIKAIRDKP